MSIQHTGNLVTSAHRAQIKVDRAFFAAIKRLFDLLFCLILLPFVAFVALLLLCLNPMFNKGSLFYVQTRMGRNCKPFKAIKFRSMRDIPVVTRSADGPLEQDRITPLGHILRKTRLDELPQILNVLIGDMSLIGPRPDYYDHAVHFLETVPGYRERHAIRPGISGLAQIQLGYIEGVAATRRKVQVDLLYIANASLRLEAWIFWRTLAVVAGRQGA